MAKEGPANRLAEATSPYLRQHAYNPVDWYPWGEEALAKARAENKPILLSIGYSACHWCHVMAHESFEDPATAEVMNRLFVNIKVDREERPDLDKIYQTSHQLLTQRPGGWPLTVFLSPGSLVPIFAGTYFPREPRHGLPGFTDLMTRVVAYLGEHAGEVRQHDQAVLAALARISQVPAPAEAPDLAPLQSARTEFASSFDARHGGFGRAPKFPHPTHIELLLRLYARSRLQQPDREALHMACLTLRRMALGGICDQVGGGFARYSVDDYWMIPHFEKMLYDNGQLLALYADAWRATGDELYARIARETAEWIVAEMQAPEGGYYSSLDADSEGEEGRFYVWTPAQVQALLDEDEYAVVERRFGLNEAPNFEGRWHFHVYATFSELAKQLGRERSEVLALWESARGKLYAARKQRVHPGRDDKILGSWNALAIIGMLRAGRLLDEPRYLDSAERALSFVRERLWQDGRLRASYKDGSACFDAYLDDYAFLLAACMESLQTRWSDEILAWARELAEALLNHFQDPDRGSFFFTADDHETLIQRPRPLMDDATPSGNGIAARALLQLGHLIGEARYLEAAERTVRVGANALGQIPHAYGSLLLALDEWLEPPEQVILRGDPDKLREWQAVLERNYSPRRLVFGIPSNATAPGVATGAGAQAALVCRGTQCLPPATDAATLERQLL